MLDKSISLFMPAFNEGENIQAAVLEADGVLKNLTGDYEIIVVNDGSTDDTKSVLDRLLLGLPSLKVIDHSHNKGIAEALKSGLYSAKKDFIFYNSADRQAKMEVIKDFLPLINDFDIVVGALKKRKDSLLRKVFSGVYHQLIYLLFGFKLRNINALKLIRKDILKDIHIESSNAFVDTEILIKARRAGYRITEVEMDHFPRVKGKQKGARLSVIIGTIRDLIKFYIKTKIRKREI